MQLLINISLLLVLGAIILQDFRYRYISWFLVPLLLALLLAQGLLFIPVKELLQHALFNSGFVILQLILLTVYISIKNKRPVNIIDSYLGLGDVLFFAATTAAFSPVNFMAFFVGGLMFTVFLYMVFILVKNNRLKEIPLAGTMAVFLALLVVCRWFFQPFSFYNDRLLTSWILNHY